MPRMYGTRGGGSKGGAGQRRLEGCRGAQGVRGGVRGRKGGRGGGRGKEEEEEEGGELAG
eukprot:767451-Hanusia_phi.AAC.6